MLGKLKNALSFQKKKAGPKILLVDDDPAILKVLLTYLEGFACEPRTAETSARAIEMLEKEGDYALLVTDVMMPGTNGLMLVDRLRKERKTKKLPVLIVTGRLLPKEMEAARQRFPHLEVMRKPVQMKGFRAAIRRGLETGFVGTKKSGAEE